MSSFAAKRRGVPFARAGEDALADADGGRGLKKIIAASKTTGALNLSNRQLTAVPEAVFSLPENDDSVKWWEVRQVVVVRHAWTHVSHQGSLL